MIKVKHLKSFLGSLLLMLLVISAHAQNVGGNMGPGGTSGGVKAGNNLFNVDLYTGTGSASIPIYSYGVDNLGLGVSLSYSTKGVRVNDASSSVGLGWQLNAYGTISREVRGIEDEVIYQTRFYSNLINQFSWGYDGGYNCNAPQVCFNHLDSLQGILAPNALGVYDIPSDPAHFYHYKVYDDQEPDLFHFNLGNRSFSFTFKKVGTSLVYYTFPKSDVKIDVTYADYDPATGVYTTTGTGIPGNGGIDSLHGIITFTITDESGNKFYFKRGDYQIKEFDLDSLQFTPHKGTYYATQNWVIDKIVTFTGKQITYQYIKAYVDNLESITEEYRSWESGTPNEIKVKEQKWKGYKNHISQISYPDGVVLNFSVDNTAGGRCDCAGDFRLKSIIIQSSITSTNVNKITYRLDQAYFNTPKYTLTQTELPYTTCSTLTSTYLTAAKGFTSTYFKDRHKNRGLRLKLKSITRIGTDNTTSELYYTFGYNATPLPYRFGPGQDYYGFPNGDTSLPYPLGYRPSTGNYDSLWYVTIPQNGKSWGANRSYNFNYAQSSVLNKITNGLGGQDSMAFVDYNVQNPVEPFLEAGNENDGLVVGKIISSDRFSKDTKTTTEYTYLSGERFFPGGYTAYRDYDIGFAYTNFFVDAKNTINGSNHGFDSIVVCQYGYNNERLSKNKYIYSNMMYQGISSIVRPYDDQYRSINATMRKHRMGIPLRTETYDELDNLTSREEQFYETKDLGDSIVGHCIYNPSATDQHVSVNGEVNCWTDRGYFEYVTLDHHRLRMNQCKVSRFVTGPGVSTPRTLSTIYDYIYDNTDHVKCIKWVSSSGDTFMKYRKYNYDYLTSFPTHTALTGMQANNMQFLLSSETWKKTTATDSILLSFETLVPDLTSGGVLRFPASFTSNLAQPLTSSQAANTSYLSRSAMFNYTTNTSYGSAIEKSKQYTAYDSRDNVAEMKINDKNLYETYIHDSKFMEQIAVVKNAKVSEIGYSSFEQAYAATGWHDGNLWYNTSYVRYPSGSPGTYPSPMTGKYIYQLGTASTDYVESKVLPAKSYIISFWSNTPVTGPNITVTLYNGTTSAGTVTTTLTNTIGNWKLYVGTFASVGTGYSLKVKNAGTGSAYIDELRIYPVNATMTTTTYKPLFGPGSTCDANNNIQYLEYDVFGVTTIVRDMRGKIISKVESATNSTDPNTTGLSINTPTY